MSSVAQPRITPEEYLRRERAAEAKSEYDDGVVYAMAGAARRHNVIATALLRWLDQRLSPNCEAYPSDMKVRVQRPRRYFYPDVTVACGEFEFEDGHEDILLNPLVIFEVLSPGTERDDRGRKFNAYQMIPSLQEYVLVSTDQYLVEYFRREGDEWVYARALGIESLLPLPSVGCEIPLREIYHRAKIPA
jgi:Uma2 family endonuclease